MVFLIPKNPPTTDLLAREGNDERVIELLKRTVSKYPVTERLPPEAL
jgi:hypothetical protein